MCGHHFEVIGRANFVKLPILKEGAAEDHVSVIRAQKGEARPARAEGARGCAFVVTMNRLNTAPPILASLLKKKKGR